jgi:hypothetical protein
VRVLAGTRAGEAACPACGTVSRRVHCSIPRQARKLSKFIAAARKVGTSARRKGSRSPSTQQTGAIREWAKASGHKASDRGRIPQNVIDAYNAAHN